ncbi:SNF2-related protein [Mesorhizobium sp.]|uniref:Mom family adenine methylcarbamoylation protein n=1 Tax=Mesorhizobium sp. TaxID=1871066 RepID=UPI000FE6F7DC|nr:SNF2-related protein [Mesorhizobium sp.]RWE37410.1 MAG: DEAD/DEAH box helicase [Mesorhizobium sp.]
MLSSTESPYFDLLERAGLLSQFDGRLRKADWEVRDVTIAEARPLVEQHHYAKGALKTGVYLHGLFRKGSDEILGVAWWLPPTRVACESVNKEEWTKVLSLSRLVLHPDCPKNAASFLLGRSIRKIKQDGRFVSLVTYADESQDHKGDIYRVTNWTYVGRTGPYPRWIDPVSGRQVAALATKTRSNAEMRALGHVLDGRFFKHKFVMHLAKPAASEPTSPYLALLEQLGLVTAANDNVPQPANDNPTSKRPRSMMRSYQRYLSDCIYEMPALLGAAEMSLGKTGATLDGVKRLLADNPEWRCLIIGPLEVVNNTWPDEIGEWDHLKDLTYTVVTGTEKERLAALKVDAQLTMINRENLQWLWKTIGGAIGWRWHILVYDESSRLKGFVRRTPAVKYKDGKKIKVKPQLTEFGVLAQARKLIKRVVELSGTPSPNGVIDLGGQAFILDQGERLGETRAKFLERWFDENQFNRDIKPKPNAETEIMARLKDLMIGLRAEDYIDLPPRHFNVIKVKLPPKVMRQYREFEKTMVAEPYDVEALSRGVLVNKLLQFANGGLYRSDPDVYPSVRETVAVHDCKIKALERIVEEAAGQSVLVAYSFQFDKERIRKKFPQAVFFDECKTFVKDWNAGKIKLGVAHPASIGHGLNLQHGGYIQCWFGLTWSLELWDQFNRRLARPGQRHHTVFIHVIVGEGTEDERQYESLQTKGITQDRITDRVRVRLAA